ncbi:hypothetical protein AVHM3334_12715 [Acidovorax sp. SUPP3334]|nr:hypothetical protein AVHM3334_12715 [Acidovorax sp. SUPP3334]
MKNIAICRQGMAADCGERERWLALAGAFRTA